MLPNINYASGVPTALFFESADNVWSSTGSSKPSNAIVTHFCSCLHVRISKLLIYFYHYGFMDCQIGHIWHAIILFNCYWYEKFTVFLIFLTQQYSVSILSLLLILILDFEKLTLVTRLRLMKYWIYSQILLNSIVSFSSKNLMVREIWLFPPYQWLEVDNFNPHRMIIYPNNLLGGNISDSSIRDYQCDGLIVCNTVGYPSEFPIWFIFSIQMGLLFFYWLILKIKFVYHFRDERSRSILVILLYSYQEWAVVPCEC